MNIHPHMTLRPAAPDDAADLAKLIDIAGEGIPTWLWQQGCRDDRTPLDIGTERARRDEGGFSYRNAILAARRTQTAGMVLSYPIDLAPEDDPDGLPAPVAPFVELEKLSVGTWYVNALAVFPAYSGLGIGTRLIAECEAMALENGYRTLTIQAFEQNLGAVRLYRRLGYTEQARSPVRLHPCQPYYTGDVLLLRKTVSR
jgi:ribosomal protein S18 acetylase RimI-like enzyme